MVSASEDDTVKFWNIADGRLLRSLKAHSSGNDTINSINITRDGQTLIGASGKDVKIWDLATGRQLHTLTTSESHTGPGFHGEQMTWCCGSEVRALALSPDDKLIVSAHEDGTIKLWDAKRPRLLRIIKSRFSDLKAVAFSPDGKLIASAYDESDSTVDFWSVQTGKRVASLGKDSEYVSSLSFSRDGRTIATVSTLHGLIVWNPRTGKPIRTFEQLHSRGDRVTLSPNGRFIVSGGENQNVLLWNTGTGKLVWSVLPIDREAEKRLHEIAAKRNAIAVAEEAARQQKLRDADKETAAWVVPVMINFDHYGEPINPLEQRFVEKGEVNKSLSRQTVAEAEGIWFRLRNNSPLPIKFRTDSFYLPRPGCGVKLSDNSTRPALCDGMEVSIQYEIEDANGKRVPYGLDMSSESVLPPDASVLFSVQKSHLSNGRQIFVSYTYLKENAQRALEEFGTSRRAHFHSSQLGTQR